MLGEAPAVTVVEGQRHPFALAECRRHGLGQPAAVLCGRGDAINENQHIRTGADALFRARFVQSHDLTIHLGAHESRGAQLCGDLDVGTLRRWRQWKRHDHVSRFPCPASRKQPVDRLLHGVPFHIPPALEAGLCPRPGPQKPQKIGDFGGCSDRGATGGGGVFLLDRDRRRQPLHRIDERLRHPFEELLSVRRERLDVTPLPFGVQRVEGERAFPRAGWTGDHRERPARELDGDALQVVLAYVAENDALGGMAHNP